MNQLLALAQNKDNQQLVKKYANLAIKSGKKQFKKQAKKKFNKTVNNNRMLSQVKDIVVQSRSKNPNRIITNDEAILNSLWPIESRVCRPIYRQASRAVYAKIVTRFVVNSTTNAGSTIYYKMAGFTINPWSLQDTIASGSASDSNTAGAVVCTSETDVSNIATYGSITNFRTYRVVGAKIKMTQSQALLTAAGSMEIGFYDYAASPVGLILTQGNIIDTQSYGMKSISSIKEIFVPCRLTSRVSPSTTVTGARYDGDMVQVLFTDLPVTTATIQVAAVELEQDVEFEANYNVAYGQQQVGTFPSRFDMATRLDNKQDLITRKSFYLDEKEILDIVYG